MAHAITALQSASRPSGAHWRIRNNRKFGKTLLAMAVFWPLCLSAQWLPTIKAVVGQPVLQELMGGCSMRCAFPWNLRSLSGKSPQIVYTLDDNDASTAWIDPNSTIGTKLQFQFPAKLPPELNGIPFYGFDFASGVVSIRRRQIASTTPREPSTSARLFQRPWREVIEQDQAGWPGRIRLVFSHRTEHRIEFGHGTESEAVTQGAEKIILMAGQNVTRLKPAECRQNPVS